MADLNAVKIILVCLCLLPGALAPRSGQAQDTGATAHKLDWSCGFGAHCCRYHQSAGARGVNDIGNSSAKPARWATNNQVPDQPSRKVTITYSIVTGSSENHAGQTLTAISDSTFIGSSTLATIKEATESWNDTCGVILTFVSSGGQLRIGGASFPGSQAGLGGFSATSSDGVKWAITEGFVQLDTADQSWSTSTLRAVCSHEVGHALGLNHTDKSDALMFPSVNSSIGPTADDRWYNQFLYGASVPKITASVNANGTVALSINKGSPIQTGTTSTDTFDGSAASPKGPGKGTGSLTQDDVVRYIVERKGPGESQFSVLNSNLTASGSQNADPSVSATANSFSSTDNNITTAGTHTYRVKSVFSSAGEDSLVSGESSANVTSPPSSSGPPVITSTLSDTAVVNASYSYTLTASGTTPITFNATNLPSGLSFSTNQISGTPAAEGTFNITLSATNADGSDTQTLVLTVSAATAGSLSVGKLQIKLNFVQGDKDSLKLSATLGGMGSGLDLTDLDLSVDIGGETVSGTLNSKGQIKTDTVTAKVKESSGSHLLTLKTKLSNHQDELDDEGLTDRDAEENIDISVTITLSTFFFSETVTTTYKATAGKKGLAKNF